MFYYKWLLSYINIYNFLMYILFISTSRVYTKILKIHLFMLTHLFDYSIYVWFFLLFAFQSFYLKINSILAPNLMVWSCYSILAPNLMVWSCYSFFNRNWIFFYTHIHTFLQGRIQLLERGGGSNIKKKGKHQANLWARWGVQKDRTPWRKFWQIILKNERFEVLK